MKRVAAKVDDTPSNSKPRKRTRLVGRLSQILSVPTDVFLEARIHNACDEYEFELIMRHLDCFEFGSERPSPSGEDIKIHSRGADV